MILNIVIGYISALVCVWLLGTYLAHRQNRDK